MSSISAGLRLLYGISSAVISRSLRNSLLYISCILRSFLFSLSCSTCSLLRDGSCSGFRLGLFLGSGTGLAFSLYPLT